MAACRWVCEHNNDDVFAAAKFGEPAGEETAAPSAPAGTHEVRLGKRPVKEGAVLRKQVRMLLGNVRFALIR